MRFGAGQSGAGARLRITGAYSDRRRIDFSMLTESVVPLMHPKAIKET